jgi:endoglucanase
MTHQGATWVSPSMINLKNMPYPYDANRMPGVPNELKNTWVEQAYNGYKNDATSQKIGETLNVAATFSKQRNVPVFCGELGVYIPNSLQEDRVRWYQDIRTKLEERKIAWTSWDYHGGFGLFTETDGLFDHHLNVDVVNALGFKSPPQTPYVLLPDTKGFPIFTDYPENGILAGGYGSERNYFETQKAKGSFGFSWSNPGLYTNASFDFLPNKDLSVLKDNNFALDFFVKSSIPNLEFDVRFLDTKTTAEDRPWRNRVKIDNTLANWDGKWHHIHLPLKDFTEHGAWDNAWFNPQGKFDWKAIDKLEIATEYTPLTGSVFFDNIIVTDQDTAMLTNATDVLIEKSDIVILNNPSINGIISMKCDNRNGIVTIYDINGRMIEKIKLEKSIIAHSKNLQKGIYFIRDEETRTFVAKVLVN